jgi:hypothetical protein
MKIKPLFFLVLTVNLMLPFLSCKKRTGGDTDIPHTGHNPLVGTWLLISENWQIYKSDEFTDGGDLKTITSYKSSLSNPTGTFAFTDSTVAINNLGYSMGSDYADYNYKNHVLMDSAVGSIGLRSFPDTGMNNTYRLIGMDSILFPQGSFVLLELGTVGPPAKEPCGGSFTISGNRLTITSIVDSVAYTMIYSGTVEDTLHTKNRTVVVFQRQ